jgi:hypothetical protein
MENPVFTRESLFDIRVIMTIVHVLVVELLCQAVTGWVLVLECLLPDTRGHQRSCPFMFVIKWPCSL